ncbi:MAG TPA: serine/threonine-protein kinase [Ktedonobacteraceae bacterium]
MKPFSFVCDICGMVNQRGQLHCLACGQILVSLDDSRALTSAPTVSTLSNTLLKQRYQVIHVVGKGGMGTVYIGRDVQLGNRLVAIKEMSQNGLVLSERLEAARNFQREAHLLAGLQHPNLPSIYDHFEEKQRWYLVMSFIRGQTLMHYLETQGGSLPLNEVLEIGITLCNVLNYLHSCNPPVIFRDLKPSNVMRTADGHIYLIDFGIARLFKPGQMADTANQGSSGYASPEQYGSAQTTPRSDIYSLGATLYHLFSGYDLAYTPFHFPSLQELVRSAPTRLVALITSMLDWDENKRPASAEIVRRELQIIQDDLAVPPAPEPSSLPLPLEPPKPGKSKKALLITLAALLLIVLLVGVYVIIGLVNGRNSNTPYGVVNTFCNAMDSQSPDFLTAYHQLSRQYQQGHPFLDFQRYLLGTNQCTIASSPNSANQAIVSLMMLCPPPPPDPNRPPPAQPPPPRINPLDLTLVQDGSDGWKIDTLYLVSPDCAPPPT